MLCKYSEHNIIFLYFKNIYIHNIYDTKKENYSLNQLPKDTLKHNNNTSIYSIFFLFKIDKCILCYAFQSKIKFLNFIIFVKKTMI